MIRNKRVISWVVSLVMLTTMVFPVRQSQAAIPLVGLAVAAVSNTGAVVSADLLVSGVTSLIGGAIAALALAPSTADAPMRVPLVSDKPTIDAAMPPPQVPLTADPVVQKPSSRCGEILAQLGTAGNVNGCPVSTTYYSNGQSWYAGGYYGCGFNRVVSSQVCPELNRTFPDDGTYSFYQAAPNSSCGAGYVSGAGGCVLENARAAASDNKADLVRSASGYSVDSAEADSLPAYARVNGGKVYAQGKNSSGQPVMIEYSVSPDGSKTYITHYTQSETADQTTVRTQSITVDSATGTVTGATMGTATGSISPAASADVVPTVSTGAAVTSSTSSGGDSIVFPTDYARAGEAAAAANTVKTAVDGVKDRLSTTEVVSDPILPDWVDPWGASWSALKGWSLPGHTSTCPVGSFSWNNQEYLINAHCQLIADHWGVITAAMSVVWVVLSLFIVLGA